MQVFPIHNPYLNNNWNKNKNKNFGKFLSLWQKFPVFVNDIKVAKSKIYLHEVSKQLLRVFSVKALLNDSVMCLQNKHHYISAHFLISVGLMALNLYLYQNNIIFFFLNLMWSCTFIIWAFWVLKYNRWIYFTQSTSSCILLKWVFPSICHHQFTWPHSWLLWCRLKSYNRDRFNLGQTFVDNSSAVSVSTCRWIEVTEFMVWCFAL